MMATPTVLAQTICFGRFEPLFYRRSLAGIIDFLRASASSLEIELCVFQHEVRLPVALRDELSACSPFPVHFRKLIHNVEHSREQPERYARDINTIYAVSFEQSESQYLFHVDGDVIPTTPAWMGVEEEQWLASWIDIIESPQSGYLAVCNIGSRYFVAGPPLYEWYRPYGYIGPNYSLRFSTQSFFCRRDLLPEPRALDIALERAVTHRLERENAASLNLHRRPGFTWTHHYDVLPNED